MRFLRFPTLLPFTILTIVTLLFHVPPLMNARDVNSDAAVVGLQAMHMLHGEFSWFLWGAGYQSSLDSLITAGFFAIFGHSALVLMLVPMFGHLILLWCTLSVLTRRIGRWRAALCCVPIVLVPWAINSVIIYPPRQWCVTICIASVWLLDRAAEAKRPLLNYFLGMLAAIVALYVDLIAIVFLPGIALLAVLCCIDAPVDRAPRKGRAIACAAGATVGAVAIYISRLSVIATNSPAKISLAKMSFNFQLLGGECLPFALGYAWFQDNDNGFYRKVFTPDMPWSALLAIGGLSLLMLIGTGAMMFRRETLPWKVRRLGLFGAIVAISCLAAFTVSQMPADFWAVRYLGPIFWACPFALAPIASRFSGRSFALMLLPYAIVAAIGGWLSYGDWLDARHLPHISSRASAENERSLVELLRKNNVRAAQCDYWLAYRLDFLYDENPIFFPDNPAQSRYQWRGLDPRHLGSRAVIFKPQLSLSILNAFAADERLNSLDVYGENVADFSVLIYRDNNKPSPAR